MIGQEVFLHGLWSRAEDKGKGKVKLPQRYSIDKSIVRAILARVESRRRHFSRYHYSAGGGLCMPSRL